MSLMNGSLVGLPDAAPWTAKLTRTRAKLSALRGMNASGVEYEMRLETCELAKNQLW